jgi:hypothetical protein
MNGSIGVILITAAGAAIISGMGLVSVRADRERRSREARMKALKTANRGIRMNEISATNMAVNGTGNISVNEGSNLAATGSTTR